MQVHKHHVIFDEVAYDRLELLDWYESVKQYTNDFGAVQNRFRDQLGGRGLNHNKEFKQGLFQTIDTKSFLDKHVIEFEPIKNLVDRFNFDEPLKDTHVDVLIYKPGYVFVPHVDFHMHCGIMFPILPAEDASPIDFYNMPPGETWEQAKGYGKSIVFERDHDYSYEYSLVHPSMFNGKIIHGVRNNDRDRVFLRFKCLSMTFERVIEKTQAGEFILQ